MGDSSCLGDASRLGDVCDALRLGGVVVNWGSRAQKGGGEFGGACIWGGVDGEAVLCDERGYGVDRGFGLVPFHIEGFDPSCLTKCSQYPSSSARYT